MTVDELSECHKKVVRMVSFKEHFKQECFSEHRLKAACYKISCCHRVLNCDVLRLRSTAVNAP